MASFLTNLGLKHKISKIWLLGMPTSVKVEGLSTVHQLQTCICSKTTPQDFQSLTLSFPSATKVRHQLQTATSHATGRSEPPGLFQWILDWNLYQNSQNSFFWSPFLSRRWHVLRKHRPSWCQGGDSIPVLTSLCRCATLRSTNDPCHMLVCPHTPW